MTRPALEMYRLLKSGFSIAEIAFRFDCSEWTAKHLISDFKDTARKEFNRAKRLGEITKPESCQVCGGGGRISAHHADYEHPLQVEWLCRKCHTKADVKIRCQYRKRALGWPDAA